MTISRIGKRLPNPKTRTLRAGGFTLIELSVVMFIFTLFVVLATVQFRRTSDGQSQRTAIQDLSELMTFAHEKAVREQLAYGVRLAADSNAYWLVRGHEGASTTDFSRVSGTWGQPHRLPQGVGLKGSDASIIFYPDGTATQNFLEFDFRGRVVSLTINPVTGQGVFHEAV